MKFDQAIKHHYPTHQEIIKVEWTPQMTLLRKIILEI